MEYHIALKKLTDKLKICIIVHKDSKEVWVAKSGKWHWNNKGAAKNAWACNRCGRRSDVPYFDQQDYYEIIEIDVSKSIDEYLPVE